MVAIEIRTYDGTFSKRVRHFFRWQTYSILNGQHDLLALEIICFAETCIKRPQKKCMVLLNRGKMYGKLQMGVVFE